MSGERCTRESDCEFEAGHFAQHPCGQRGERPGEPCRYCDVPVPLDGSSCPTCWIPAADAVPLLKAAFAEHGISINVRIEDNGA